MLSVRVDLTENRDFNKNINDFVNGHFILYDDIGASYRGTNMSIEEYNRIRKWEDIFGQKNHYSEFLNIFRQLYTFRHKIIENTVSDGSIYCLSNTALFSD